MPEINSVNLTGNLTKDPELRSTPGGTSVATLRIASNTRRKNGDSWEDKPNYFDVVVWGRQAENVCNYLSKGSKMGVSGRLEWREWKDKNDNPRQSVEIVAEQVVFLGSKDSNGNGNGNGAPAHGDLPGSSGTGGLDTGGSTAESDIPF